MKYTIFGFSQQAVLDLNESTGAGIDITDLQILDWFVDFFAGAMDKRQIGENVYGWVLARKVCEEFPLLGLKEQAVRKRLKKLVDAGVLESRVVKNKQDGTKAFYRLTAVGASLRYDSTDTEIHTRIYDGIHPGIYDGTNPVYTTVYDKDSPSSNPPTINPPRKKERKRAGYDEIIASYTENGELRSALVEFVKMRKMMKKPLTNKGLSLLLTSKKGLDGLASNDAEKIDVVQQSIMRGWLGFFPLKDMDAKGNTVSRETTSGFDKKIDADYYYQSTGDEEVDRVLGLGKYAPNKR